MKRSKINNEIKWALELLEKENITLPPFGYWTLNDWKQKDALTSVIKQVMLGWDITDFGNNRFDEFGAVLFTLRNGLLNDKSIGTPYAEKLIILKEGQRLPLHYHKSKTEDIINRAGGIMGIKLYNSKSDGSVDETTKVDVFLDGVKNSVEPGTEILIRKGESITLVPYMYHLFYAKEGHGDLVCGEVSSVNDDLTDNYNGEPVSRFSKIEEDEEVLFPLCNEYQNELGDSNV